jgi:hypothetical protein
MHAIAREVVEPSATVQPTRLDEVGPNGDAVLGLTLLAAGLPWALWNETRPFVGNASVLRVPRLHFQRFVDPRVPQSASRSIALLYSAADARSYPQ